MGYVAFLGGTLIVAVLIHSLWARKGNGLIKANEERDNNHSEPCGKKQEANTVLIENVQIGDDNPVPAVAINKPEPFARRNLIDSATRGLEIHANKTLDESGVSAATRQSVPARHTERVLASPLSTALSNDHVEPSRRPQMNMMPPPGISPTGQSPAIQSTTTSARQGGLQKPSGFSSLAPPMSVASSLRVPQQKILSNTKMQPASSLTTSTQHPSNRSSRKVILAPGHSPLDWAALTKDASPSAPAKLRGANATEELGPFKMGRIPHKRLKQQTGRKGKDAWTSYQGRVYNISAYLDFHPGGRDELMKGAGRSSDKLFAEVHPWVNWDGMLSGCLIGMLVNDDDPAALGHTQEAENELDQMD